MIEWPNLGAKILLLGVLFVALGYPAGCLLAQVGRFEGTETSVSPENAANLLGIGRSILYAGMVAIGATACGMPAAWCLCGQIDAQWRSCDISRNHSAIVRPSLTKECQSILFILPLLLPNYLAYAAWGILRGPNTYLGDWIAHREPWVAIGVAKACAVLGLVLWVWPLAMLVQIPMLRRIPDGVLDALKMDGRGACGLIERARFVAPAFGGSVLVVGLVMMGSAVPLHVAQVQTYAIQLWKTLQVSSRPVEVWGSTWPLLAMGACAAGIVVWGVRRVVARRSGRESEDVTLGRNGGRTGRWVWGLAWCVWGLSVPVPAVLFLTSLRQWRSVVDFWRVDTDALVESLLIGGCVGALGVAVCVVTMQVLVMGRRTGLRRMGVIGGIAVWAWVMLGLVPGVLVGTAYNTAFAGMFGHGAAANIPTVLAHLARWGFVAVLVAVRVFVSELETLRQMRMMDETGRGSAVSFWALFIVPNRGVLAGVFLAMVCLSMHEIESTIMVQPPGSQPLAQVLLDYLHFARDEQLSAACVNMLGVGGVLALAAGWLLGPVLVSRASSGENERMGGI